MAGMMKAAICKQAKAPLVIEEIPIPEPSGREIRVRVKAASLCHSDLSIITGEGPAEVRNIFPVILGHEAVSVVDKLGPEAAPYGFREGDLVGASLWHNMCLNCNECKTAGPDFCPTRESLGITRPGNFAEYTLIDPASALLISRPGVDPSVEIPPPAALSPLFCAGITVWDGLERAHIRPGETVAVVGAGGLGELAVRYVQALGAKVLALDVRDDQLQACKEYADGVINTYSLSPVALKEKIAQMSGRGTVDVALVTAGAAAAYEAGLSILKPEGKLIAAGIPLEILPLPILQVTFQAIHIIGCRSTGQAGVQKCLDFSLRKKILPRVNPRKFRLEEINEMIALMEANQVQDGRMVIEFPW